MKYLNWLAVALIVFTRPLFAAPKTVVLSVPGMSCAACPITVRKAITRVDGVSGIDVDYDTRRAVVTYDDARANIEKILRATANAGYPAMLKGEGK